MVNSACLTHVRTWVPSCWLGFWCKGSRGYHHHGAEKDWCLD
jgi:hypothetical protein